MARCCRLVLNFIVIVVAFIVYQYYTFSYHHRVSDHYPPKQTNVKDWNWNQNDIRNYKLTESELGSYSRDGFVVIRNAIPVEIIDALYNNIPPHTLSWYLQFIETYTMQNYNSHFTFDHVWPTINEYRDLWFYSPLIENYISPIFGTETKSIRLLTDYLFGIQNKPFSFGTYHQDTYAYNMADDNSKGVTLWIPLMDVNASNNGGSIFMVNKSLSKFMSHNVEKIASKNAVLIDYFNKGDILLFNKFTVHKSQPIFKKDMVRYAYCGRIIDGNEAIFSQTFDKRVMSKKHVCRHNLIKGDLLNSPCYPQLYPNKLENETEIIMENGLEFPTNDVHVLLSMYDSFYETIDMFVKPYYDQYLRLDPLWFMIIALFVIFILLLLVVMVYLCFAFSQYIYCYDVMFVVVGCVGFVGIVFLIVTKR